MPKVLESDTKLDRSVITSKHVMLALIKVNVVFTRLVCLKQYSIAVAWRLVFFVNV